MRIVQLVMRRQRRGAEVFAAQLSDALVRRGHEVLLLGLYPPPADALVPELARYADLPGGPSRGVSLRRMRSLAAAIEAERPDLVQANGSDTLKYSSLVRRRGGEWSLVYRNISIASSWLRYPGQKAWLRWLLRQVDDVAAISEASLIDFRDTYRLDPSRLTLIPNGVVVPETVDRRAARIRLAAAASLPDEAEVLLHIGSLSPEKNHLWMIDSLGPVFAARPNVHLVLFGDGPLREEILARVGALGLERRIHWLGTRPDAARMTAGADLLLLASVVEGIPGVILEAAAHGTPSVATDVGSVSDAVEDGRTGMLVDPGDDQRFSASILQLLTDRQTRERMGNLARESVQRSYCLQAIVAEFESLYKGLTCGSRTAAT